jgi:hypothetical protein
MQLPLPFACFASTFIQPYRLMSSRGKWDDLALSISDPYTMTSLALYSRYSQTSIMNTPQGVPYLFLHALKRKKEAVTDDRLLVVFSAYSV